MRALAAALALSLATTVAHAGGARSFKSGPIQITADGSRVWVVNPDHDSVSRIDTATDTVVEYPLPQPGGPPIRHAPSGVAVTEDGAEVWVACHDSDRVYVLRGSDGVVLARVDLPWGSGPYGVALSRDQSRALVTLLRSSRVAVIDRPARSVIALLDTFRSPLGVAFMEDGVSAWITHRHVLDRLPRVSRIDLSAPGPRVTTQERTDGAGPQDNAALHDPISAHNVAEGGYLNFRGQLAQRPGTTRVWVPTQYDNRNQTVVTPDGILQATLRQIDLTTRRIPNTIADKIILSAKQVHDPQNSAWLGPGWDLGVAGPDDVAFSSDGGTVYVVGELSENLVVMPAATPPYRDGVAPSPVVVDVGRRPQGVAVSPAPVGGHVYAYVANLLSRDVSKVDVTTWSAASEAARIPVTPATVEPRSAAFLNGDRLFHSSADPRVSSNRKVACGSCHVDGEQDGRAWDLQHLPGAHGPRQTQSILGLGLSMGPRDPATGLGQLHRSGDRDEVQDFDHTFRGPQMGGTGFIPPALLQPELGPPNAGRDPDLDDVAAYVLGLAPLMRSPARNADGTLSEAAVRGATFFVGAGARPADARCASCHVPETGFVDLAFHDVGERHDPGEAELNTRAPLWGVNTAPLVGAWDSPPYAGVAQPKDAESLVEAVLDFRRPGRTASHGAAGGLTQTQVRDLAEFLASIDGDTTAAEVRAAADHASPRVVRVEPASLTRVDAWFSESVSASAAVPSAWRLRAVGGPDVPILGASLDPQNGDRVTFTVGTLHHDCGPVTYVLIPQGSIFDRADSATGGVANALDLADPLNMRTFAVGDTLSVTFGASGYENFTIPMHDSGTVFGSAAGANGSVWLRSNNNGAQRNLDFVRFEWEQAFAATGVVSPNSLVDASFSLMPAFGDAQTIEARRVLQRWWDYGGPDLTQGPVNPVNGHGGATYSWSEFNVKAWNAPNAGARAAGINGASASDYFGTRDTAFDPDAVVTLSAIDSRAVFSGPGVLAAFRFWLQNPTLDQGYAVQLTSAARHETRFRASEEELRRAGPVLSITYLLPPTTSPPLSEVSAPGAAQPLRVDQVAGGDLVISFEDLGGAAGAYDLYEGVLGGGYNHAPRSCNAQTTPANGRRQVQVTPAAGSTYYLVTAADLCQEGTSGADSAGVPRPSTNLTCSP
jgi:DNA-binding beta-propeller fold protein YncE/mono/diheme cytochrome c family protein